MTDDRTIRTAVVTGGSRGFGRAVVADLAARGWVVVTDGRDPVTLEWTATAVGAVAVPGDIGDAAHRRALVETAVSRTGRLDLVVNSAGDLGPSPLPLLAELPLTALTALMQVNVVAALGLIQEALPHLRRAGGAVINVTSDAAVEPYPGWGGYGATKAALEQLSAVLAEEEAGRVRVWWLDPGDMRTDMHQRAFPGEDISDRPDPATVAPTVGRLVEQQMPSGRVRAAEILAGSAGSAGWAGADGADGADGVDGAIRREEPAEPAGATATRS